jgi:SAM-dependent MidA family methyltransferase
VTPLEAEIRRLIAIDGPIPIARYMAMCLTHPEYGYYATRDPIGARGDFVTAPEISQMLGELIGLWAAAVWNSMGSPRDLRLVELGPGRGTLMCDALRAVTVVPAFRTAIEVHLVEKSSLLRRCQNEALAGLGVPLAWHDDLSAVPEGPLIVIANEFFDALPVHQAVKAPDGWHERVIGIDAEDRLAFGLNPAPVRGLDALLPPRVRAAGVGAVHEWRSEDTVSELAKRFASAGGAALIVDYGYTESDIGETLQGMRGHDYADPLEDPGEVDLTAHVDFAALARAAARGGARAEGPVGQGTFLRRLGIAERAAALTGRATARQANAIESALARLTATGPTGMGELFKVLAIASKHLPPLPGFDT